MKELNQYLLSLQPVKRASLNLVIGLQRNYTFSFLLENPSPSIDVLLTWDTIVAPLPT